MHEVFESGFTCGLCLELQVILSARPVLYWHWDSFYLLCWGLGTLHHKKYCIQLCVKITLFCVDVLIKDFSYIKSINFAVFILENTYKLSKFLE